MLQRQKKFDSSAFEKYIIESGKPPALPISRLTDLTPPSGGQLIKLTVISNWGV
jgi:hypothetical protein